VILLHKLALIIDASTPSIVLPIIELEEVSKAFGSRHALTAVNLSIRPGVSGLLGPNGSGKSTLIKTLLGLVRPTGGKVRVLGYELPGAVRAVRDNVGYVPEDDCFISGLTGIESAQMVARLSGLAGLEALRRAHEVLDFADIGQERYRAVESYSTGMRQKLKFAQALIHDPQLLILDEPTTGLDPDQRHSMLKRIGLLSREFGKSVLLSTHILPDVREVCDQVIILSRGRIRVTESLATLSKPMRSGLHLRTVGAAESLVVELRHLGYEVTQPARDQIGVIGLESQDSQLLWQAAYRARVAISRIEPATNSLEQIFLEAVRESGYAPA